MQLRPYQVDAITKLRASYAAGHRAPCLVLPTGGGKTVVASAVIKGAIDRGNRVLFLAHRTELLDQTMHKLENNGITDVRMIRASVDLGSPTARVVVASIPTLTRRATMPDADLVVFDECHHVMAKTWARIADRYSKARLLGMTATPQRADGKPLGDIFDAIVVGATVQQLVDLGHLVPCLVKAPAQLLDSAELAISPLDAYRADGGGQRAVVFCMTIEHAQAVAGEFNAAGIKAGVVHGKLTGAVRKRTLDDPSVRVLVNVHVLTEGWDDPTCTVCILTRRPQHDGTFLQMIGRVLRPSPGKTRAVLLDLCGSVHEHGTPDCTREFSLTGKGISRDAEREPIRQCPTCGAVWRMAEQADGCCPVCGAVMPVRALALPSVTGVGIAEITSMPARPMPTILITAKHPGWCRICFGRIQTGSRIYWSKDQKPRHQDCGTEAAMAEANRLLRAAQ